MRIHHLYLDALPQLPPIALTIGNFDGVHLGHQAMLSALRTDAAAQGLTTAAMIFEPQPREFFNPDKPPARLTALHEKASLLASFGVAELIVARFDNDFRSLSAHAFAQLLSSLNVRHLVLGDDFRFGHDRTGDKDFLLTLGFSVAHLPTISAGDVRVSSTAIRQALDIGDLVSAEQLLGRAYSITGTVMHGDKIGRTLGFPTANVTLNRPRPAMHGVYGADVLAYKDGQAVDLSAVFGGGIHGKTPQSLFGTVNVGTRPSVQGSDYRLEVHLPNFAGDLYGYDLQVIFRHFLHGERHYPSRDALSAGIGDDIAQLITWHNENH